MLSERPMDWTHRLFNSVLGSLHTVWGSLKGGGRLSRVSLDDVFL